MSEVQPPQAEYSKPSAGFGFALVWIIGIAASVLTFRLAISGTLWRWGLRSWLIWLSVLVGIWQWIWIAPMLAAARRLGRRNYYTGLLRGGASFSVLQLGVWFALYIFFRKMSLQ